MEMAAIATVIFCVVVYSFSFDVESWRFFKPPSLCRHWGGTIFYHNRIIIVVAVASAFLFLSLWLLFSFLFVTPFVNVVLRLFWFLCVCYWCCCFVLCFQLLLLLLLLPKVFCASCAALSSQFLSFFFLFAQDSHVDKAVEAICSLNQSNRRSCTTWSRFLCIIPTHVQMAGSGFERKTIDWSANTQLSPLSQLNHERSTAKSWVVRSYI